jgi:excisionase family DNA binding protein
MFTLGQAAKQTGISKTGIARAINSGRLSATKEENGEYRIDPAELHRVYPVTGGHEGESVRPATLHVDGALQGQVDVLRELLEQVKDERDDLRRRLDDETKAREGAAAEIRQLTMMLTHQPPAKTVSPVRAVNPWLWIVLAAVAIGAAVVRWVG